MVLLEELGKRGRLRAERRKDEKMSACSRYAASSWMKDGSRSEPQAQARKSEVAAATASGARRESRARWRAGSSAPCSRRAASPKAATSSGDGQPVDGGRPGGAHAHAARACHTTRPPRKRAGGRAPAPLGRWLRAAGSGCGRWPRATGSGELSRKAPLTGTPQRLPYVVPGRGARETRRGADGCGRGQRLDAAGGAGSLCAGGQRSRGRDVLPVPLVVRALVLATLFLIPVRIVGHGYRPTDDALRHAAKAVSGKSWDQILVLRPDVRVDSHPGGAPGWAVSTARPGWTPTASSSSR